jgi:DNA-binding NarL/FixJ family response regulator
MVTFFVASLSLPERIAFRLMLEDLGMQVVGEADNWASMLSGVLASRPEAIVVDWDLLVSSHSSLAQIRRFAPQITTVVLVSSLNARKQAAVSAGADIFICRDDTPDRVAESLRVVNEHNGLSYPNPY